MLRKLQIECSYSFLSQPYAQLIFVKNKRLTYIFLITLLYIIILLLKQMKAEIQSLLFFVVLLTMPPLLTPQCLIFKAMQCIECQLGYHFKGQDCVSDLVKIKERGVSTNQKSFNPANISHDQAEGIDSYTVNNLTSAHMHQDQFVQVRKVQSSQAKTNPPPIYLGIPQSDLLNLVKIVQIPKSDSKSAVSNLTIDGGNLTQSNIQYSNNSLMENILTFSVNKISLQLFEFSRVSAFHDEFDPITKQILKRIQETYRAVLLNSKYLVSFHRFLTFTKGYKVFYYDLAQKAKIEIYEVDAIVDLFHMQIFISRFVVYCKMDLNESTLEWIKAQTKRK